jgi:hypothetical protein
MDPRADCLLGPGLPDFYPPGVDRDQQNALIPFILSVQSTAALTFVETLLPARPDSAAAGDSDNSQRRGPVAFPVIFPGLEQDKARIGATITILATLSFLQGLLTDEGFVDAPKQIQLCLPLGGPCVPEWKQGVPPPLQQPRIGPPAGGWPDGTVIVGVIDDGIAFANARFRHADNTSRVQCFWHQDGFPPTATVPYGRETLKAEIDTYLVQCTTAGSVDEDAVYRRANLVNFTQPWHKAAALRLAHGTHVLDLGAGHDPNNDPKRKCIDCPIIAVQLPVAATAKQSGAGLESYVQDAIAYIQSRALLLAGNGPALPVVINFSYATVAGPHDGTWLLEQSVDLAVTSGHPPTRIVLPSGNENLTRGHKEINFDRWRRSARLHWRKQPDDLTLSMMQVWLPFGGAVVPPASRVFLSIVTPDGLQSPPLGEISGQGILLLRDGQIICAAHYSFQPFPTERGVFNICLMPTVRLLPSALAGRVASSGVWTIKLHNILLQPQDTVNAWIERDDLVYGYPRRGRQSYFDEVCYEVFDEEGFVVDRDAEQPPCDVRRDGMINAIATGLYPDVVGGYIRKDRRFAQYSAGGPITPARAGALALYKPDCASVSDDSKVHYGVLASGSHSGSTVPMAGTSVAAPQLTRWLACQLAVAAAPTDRAAVEAFAAAEEALLGPPKPPLLPDRGGQGRIDFPYTMAGARTRYWLP